MPETVQRLWYENVLLRMEREIQTAKAESRAVDQNAIHRQSEFIRTTRTNSKGRRYIIDRLENILDEMPNDGETLIAKVSVKALYHELKKPRRRDKRTTCPEVAHP